MNQPTTYRINPTSITLPESNSASKSRSLLLGRIFSKFWKTSKFYSTEYRTTYRHQSFKDANLLDQNVGSEICRTLRQ